MCKVMEDMRAQMLREVMKDVAIRMLRVGKYAMAVIGNFTKIATG